MKVDDLLFGTAAFDQFAVLHDDDSVVIDDTLETMSNADDDRIFQCCANDTLNHGVRVHISGRRGLVKNENSCRTK